MIGDDFFDLKFHLYASDNKAISLFQDKELRTQFINVFTTNMRGLIEFKPLKEKKQDETVLDADNHSDYLLTYFEDEFSINNERQRKSFQRRLNILLDIAKKIDSLT